MVQVNISLIVDDAEAHDVVQRLHWEFFDRRRLDLLDEASGGEENDGYQKSTIARNGSVFGTNGHA